MSDDPKADFYLANRALIEEWAALRAPVVAALDRALLDAAALSSDDGVDVPALFVTEDRVRRVWLDCTSDPLPVAQVALIWEQGKLLRPASGLEQWPCLAIWMDPVQPDPVRHAVRAVAASARDTHGLVEKGKWWLRWGPVIPASEPIVIEEYAQYCIERVRDAWVDLSGPIRTAVQTTTTQAPMAVSEPS